jgi:GTP cyclohydrolase I
MNGGGYGAVNGERHATIAGKCNGESSSSRALQSDDGNDQERKLQRLADAYKTILECVGEDPEREGLVKTPMRAAKAMMFLTQGYQQSTAEIVNKAVFTEDADGLVVVRDIDFSSLCEHHLVPFKGRVHIGYIPNGKVLGLSKFVRITNVFARRLQVQERLTKQIADAIAEELAPLGVAVMIESEHLCMVMRGVEKSGSSTVSTSYLGEFKTDRHLRQEFLAQLKK